MDDATVATAAAEEVAQRNRIAEVRPAREGEMFTPDTPWRRRAPCRHTQRDAVLPGMASGAI